MLNSPPSWVDPLMRIGYAARAVVYVVVGAFAFTAAISGARAPDSKGALATFLDEPFGKALLIAISLGLAAYALWSFIECFMDLANKGDEPKGWAARTAQFLSGAVHLTLAVSVGGMALNRSQESGDNTEHWTAQLMQQPFGRILVGIVGAVVIAMGVQHFIKAYKEKYKEHLRYTHTTERLDPLVKLGIAAHGLVIFIVGAFFIWSAWTADPSQAGGLRDALAAVRSADAGQILLAIVGIGLIGFSVYCFIEAAFRVIPRCAPPGLETLATRARSMMPRTNRMSHAR